MSTDLQLIESEIYGLKDNFAAALADPSIRFEAEAGFAVQILSSNSYALSIAKSNRPSVIAAVMNIAAIGISLNPAKKQAYLVPRDGKICLDISYMGMMELAVASGSIRWAQAHLVHEEDKFRPVGYDRPPLHEYEPFKSDRGGVIGVYVVAKTADGDYLTHCMDIASVYAIRDRSQAWKAYVERQKKCPWVTDAGEMIKKTCVKQASKYWPTTDRLDKAIHHLNVDAGEGLDDLAGNESAQSDLARLISEAKATKTADELRSVSRAAAKHFNDKRDRDGYAAYAAVVQAHGAAFKQPEAANA